MRLKALGGCCKKSQKNYENIKKAVNELNLNIAVEQVSDINEIMKYGMVSTPGFVINDKVVSSGVLLSVAEATSILKNNLK